MACYDGFGNLDDGRPIWIGNFWVWHGGTDILFYYPGDQNWWLGSIVNGQLTWSLVGNTAGFGQVADGRPFWVGYFGSLSQQELLFYYPGDQNWWLGSIVNGQLTWSLVGNTAGFGQVADGRPFWVGDFNADARSDLLFYYPGDQNWWLGSIVNGQLTWSLVGNTAGFGQVADGRPFWVGYFSGVFRADILFYYPGDGNWWLGTITGSQLNWQLVGNTGKPHRERVRLHIKIIEPTTTQAFIDTRVNAMKQIYSDNGILVEVASTENLSSNMTILPLRDLSVGACAGAATAAQGTLFANRNNVGADEVVAYFIRSTTPTALNGCATFPAGQPGAVITSIASQWTLAHEIGHVLGLAHLPSEVCPPKGAAPTRLMTGCGTGLQKLKGQHSYLFTGAGARG